MSEVSNRRRFLRLLLDETVRGARDAAPLMPGPVGVAARSLPPSPDRERPGQLTVPALPAQARVSVGELDDLAVGFGLEARADALRALSRTSIRLTAPAGGVGPRGSYLFAGAEPPGDVGPRGSTADGLRMLARIDLAELSALRGDVPLPIEGELVLLWALGDRPSGLSLQHAGSVAVVHLQAAPGRRRQRRAQPVGGRRVVPSAELSLPRAWSAPVEALDLSPAEQDGWQQLRDELASLQGLDSPDDDSSPEAATAIHRCLGYPDERLGQMRLACEAAALGLDLGGRPPYLHPQASELELGANRWELLLQLSVDATLGWDWGPGRRRLYVWIDRDDLRSARFSDVWALLQ